jgi:hypothetical protein
MPNMVILSPTLASSSPANLSSQATIPNGINSEPMTTLKRTYVHMVTPTRSIQINTTVSPLLMLVKDMVSNNDEFSSVL